MDRSLFETKLNNTTKPRPKMRLNCRFILGVFGLIGIISGCNLSDPDLTVSTEIPSVPMEEISVPKDFQFSLRASNKFLVNVQTQNGLTYPGVRVQVLNNKGKILATGFTDENGESHLSFVTTSCEREVVVRAPAIGVVQSELQIVLGSDENVINIR